MSDGAHIDRSERDRDWAGWLALRLADPRICLSWRWGLLAGLAGVGAISAVDSLTGDIIIAMPYVLFVIIIAWVAPRWVAVIVALVAAAAWLWFGGPLTPDQSVPFYTTFLLRSLGLVGQALLVSMFRQATDAERRLSVRDPLTGLMNRRGFAEAAERELARARRTGETISLALLDLDDFKAVNDARGHASGDATLVAFAEQAAERLRATDVVGRHGGDEFSLLLDADAEQAALVVEQLRVVPEEHDHPRVTCSAGIAVFERAPSSLDDAFKLADRALYQAKRKRGVVVERPVEAAE